MNAKLENLSQFLTGEQLAEMLGVSLRTIEKWRLLGRGPKYRKLCGAVRYASADVAEWVQSCATGGGQAA